METKGLVMIFAFALFASFMGILTTSVDHIRFDEMIVVDVNHMHRLYTVRVVR